MTFDQIDKYQSRLVQALKTVNVEPQKIKAVIDSGYILLPPSYIAQNHDNKKVVIDTFYNNKAPSSFIPFEQFVEYMNGKEHPIKYNPLRFKVSSLAEARKILERPENKRYSEMTRLCFRGQTKEFFTHRAFPNPRIADKSGREPIVMPGFWRDFQHSWNDRFGHAYCSLFGDIRGDEFVYYGIKDWNRLQEINFNRYGYHDISDLEDFPDSESQEYFRRYTDFKIHHGANNDLPVVEQHYGIKTNGLDVTFDIAVALFFASHKMVSDAHGLVHFEMIDGNKQTGLVYMFVFESPPLKGSEQMIKAIPSFSHMRPERPIRQKCALPFFHSWGINEAICDCHAILEISHDFCYDGLPKPADIFPGPDDDPFYKIALEFKKKRPELYGQFTEYVV